MTSINLKSEYIQDIADDPILRAHIEKSVKRSNPTILRWTEDKNDMLGHISVLKAISKYKGVSVDELIEEYTEDSTDDVAAAKVIPANA